MQGGAHALDVLSINVLCLYFQSAATGMATSSSRPSPVEEEADLVVDGDDSATYGPPQYSEADVVMTSADGPREEKEREALREALIR